MLQAKTTSSVKTAIESINLVLARVAQVVLVAMMLLTVVDVIGRYAFNHPIIGSTEITQSMMVTLALGMGWVALRGKHIKMDMIVQRFAPRTQAVIDSFFLLVSLVVYGIITFQTFREVISERQYHLISAILQIPFWPIYLILAISFLVLFVVVLLLLVENVAKAVQR